MKAKIIYWVLLGFMALMFGTCRSELTDVNSTGIYKSSKRYESTIRYPGRRIGRRYRGSSRRYRSTIQRIRNRRHRIRRNKHKTSIRRLRDKTLNN
jgi:hypothetical protein